jgi:hypothetical protein
VDLLAVEAVAWTQWHRGAHGKIWQHVRVKSKSSGKGLRRGQLGLL